MDESSNDWKHIYYFILLDIGLGYDLLSSVFTHDIDLIGTIFHGSMFNHLTSQSLWVSHDEKFATLHPSGRKGLFAWGWGGGSQYPQLQRKL